MARYTALAPLQLEGREIRSGDAFEAAPETGDPLVEAGLARSEDHPARRAADTPAKGKKP
jgi:hypothetical protein